MCLVIYLEGCDWVTWGYLPGKFLTVPNGLGKQVKMALRRGVSEDPWL